jgi:hypothetical protein
MALHLDEPDDASEPEPELDPFTATSISTSTSV